MHTARNPSSASSRSSPARVGEALGIEGEDAVAVHVVDVQVQRVARDAAGAELARDPAHLLRVRVAPARLVVAERPQRRERDPAREPGVAVEHVARRRAGEDVGHEVAARRLVGHAPGVRLGEVDLQPVRVVEEDAVRAPVLQGEHERDRRVEVVQRRGVPGRAGPRSRTPGASRSSPARWCARRSRRSAPPRRARARAARAARSAPPGRHGTSRARRPRTRCRGRSRGRRRR